LLTKLRFFLALLFGKLHDKWWLEAYRLSQKQWTLSSRTYKPPEKESSIFFADVKGTVQERSRSLLSHHQLAIAV
jgi:hypothetical protein